MNKTVFKSLAIVLSLGLTVPSLAQEAPKTKTFPDQPEFSEWLVDLKKEALAQGIPETLFDQAFDGISLNKTVIELDKKQPEFTVTFQDYIEKRLSNTRIDRGLAKLASHKDRLDAVAEKYGVQKRFITAIWGLETNYGGFTGGMNVVRSLATLAYDPRRSAYFRKELLMALQILNEGHIDLADFKGSWAGAMGQSQFMPTSFKAYAQDFDQDGRRDIWTTDVDALASIANYLKRYKWRNDMTWGRQVTLPENFDQYEEDIKQKGKPRGCRAERQHSDWFTLDDWQKMGVRRLNGDDLPAVNFKASLIRPAGKDGPAFLTYSNYRAILRYNCSNLYALSVSLLSDKFK